MKKESKKLAGGVDKDFINNPEYRFLAIDPGKECGWAWYTLREGKWTVESGTCVGDQLGHVFAVLNSPGHRLVNCIVLEEPQKFGLMGVESFKQFMYSVHAWRILAEMRGIRVNLVKPSIWQSYFHLHNKRPHLERKHWKEKLRKFAETVTEIEIATSDEADALLIGEYWKSTFRRRPEEL